MICYYIKKFGFKWFVMAVIDNVWQKVFKKVSPEIFVVRANIAKEYLYKKYNGIIKKCSDNKEFYNIIGKDSNIFVLWYQGYESMPAIVKLCYDSIIKHKCNHKVILLDKKNILNYFPKFSDIKKKFDDDIFTKNYLSDVMKGYFLYNYGGIWLDSTIYLSNDIDDIIDINLPYCNIRHKDIGRGNYDKYSAYCFASGKNNKIMKFIYDLFFEYLLTENKSIYYFLIDAIFQIAYETSNACKNMIDSVNVYNYDADCLCNVIDNNLLSSSIIKKNIKPLNKLSYKSIDDATANKFKKILDSI